MADIGSEYAVRSVMKRWTVLIQIFLMSQFLSKHWSFWWANTSYKHLFFVELLWAVGCNLFY